MPPRALSDGDFDRPPAARERLAAGLEPANRLVEDYELDPVGKLVSSALCCNTGSATNGA
jgi:hypothetical protein